MSAAVRAGYKLTEVGVIPEDWAVLTVSTLTTEFRGGAPLKPTDFTDRGVKVLPKGGVGRTGILRIAEKDIQYCRPEYADAHPRNQVNKAYTIVVLRDLVPSGPSIGLMVEIDTEESFVLAQGVYGFKVNKERADARYLIQLSNTNLYRNIANSIMVGSTQVHITNTAYKNVALPVPPLSEQRAIATALSDVDALLAKLDALIAKKRDLKVATMQQLLTGQTRLPGFSGVWEVKRLGDVVRITTGKKDVNEGNPAGQYPFFTCARAHTFSDNFSFDCEAILIAGNGEVGNLNYFNGKFEAYQRTYVLQNFAINVSYLWHQLTAHLVQSLDIGTIGSSIPYIKMENLVGFEFQSPIDALEQTAIASVLSDMDTELTALEVRRDKTRALKQGMMQELLTGRIRLV